jgi:hypothetical protein
VALDCAEMSKTDESCPFGIGQRGCPAGSLSLLIAREVIQKFIATGYKWRLTNKDIDSAWMLRTKRVPTLIIEGAVSLTFEM